jgi:hypothetical protein
MMKQEPELTQFIEREDTPYWMHKAIVGCVMDPDPAEAADAAVRFAAVMVERAERIGKAATASWLN